MTLQKAITIGLHKVSHNVFQVDPDALEALKLLINAGIRIQHQRSMNPPIPQPPLKGETFG